ALKSLNKSSDSTNDLLKEIDDNTFFIQCLGISQEPKTQNYIMVMEFASS
ncbi:31246_t:CDS:2, partial [Racocetra persica]